MQNAIEIRNLSKTFGPKTAVNNLNMTVPTGSIYGFIGENGSGKSTTEKMICGLLLPSSGTIKIFGKDYNDSSVRKQMGLDRWNPDREDAPEEFKKKD